ncbi:MAG: Fic family protein, partial [Planctomycetota bacterium]|nr:Fic family protein [Planctomycetota bacterium]
REKQVYYKSFGDYRDANNTKTMEKVLSLALMESMHKRITYLKGDKIITLSDYTKQHGKSASALSNAARRQTIPAFREKGVWKIGESFDQENN